MSYTTCPSCGGAPAPDRTCKLCGRAGPSTAITQAELDAINARVAELKRLLDEAKPPEPPVYFYSPWVFLSSKPFSDGPRLSQLFATPSDDAIMRELGLYEYSSHFVDEKKEGDDEH